MDNIKLLANMDQLEAILLDIMNKMPKGFRAFMIKKITDNFKEAEENQESDEEFVTLCALYGLSHIFQIDKRNRNEK